MIKEFLNDIITNKPALIIDTSPHNQLIPPIDLAKRQKWKPKTQYDLLPEMDSVYNYINSYYEFEGKIGELQWPIYRYVGNASTTWLQENKQRSQCHLKDSRVKKLFGWLATEEVLLS